MDNQNNIVKKEIIENGIIVGYQFYRENKLIAITLKPGYEATVKLENIKFKINLGTEESEQK